MDEILETARRRELLVVGRRRAARLVQGPCPRMLGDAGASDQRPELTCGRAARSCCRSRATARAEIIPRKGDKPERVPARRSGQVHVGRRREQLRSCPTCWPAVLDAAARQASEDRGCAGGAGERYRGGLTAWAARTGQPHPRASGAGAEPPIFYLLFATRGSDPPCPRSRRAEIMATSTTSRSTRPPLGDPPLGLAPARDRPGRRPAPASSPPFRRCPAEDVERVIEAVRLCLASVTELRG